MQDEARVAGSKPIHSETRKVNSSPLIQKTSEIMKFH